MFEGLSRLTFQPGEKIFQQDKKGDCAYLIETGNVEVSMMMGEEYQKIAVLGKDELFGEMALIDNKPRSATVTAVEETRVIEISKELIESKMAKENPIIQHLLLLLLKRFRNTQYQASWKDRLSQIEDSMEIDENFSATQQHLVGHIRIASDINRALRENEFLMYYQPIISIQDSSLVGFEALIRWQHPTEGFMSPYQFLTIAEESDQIIDIGHWSTDRVCQEYKHLAKVFQTGVGQDPLFISINLSARQLTRAEDVADFARIVQQHGLDPACIKIEVTETVLVEDPDTAHDLLSSLRAMGFHIALDDFGTGYSSLSYLQKFSFDTLKIDQSFVRNMLTKSSSMQIVNASIGLARGLELDVVAEGIEHKEELDKLKETQCNYAQGYYIARPMPLDAAIAYIEQSNTFSSEEYYERTG